jgi:hypothetical protein
MYRVWLGRLTFFDPDATMELTDIIEIYTLEHTKLPKTRMDVYFIIG